MTTTISHPLGRPLYALLRECNGYPLEKEVLDCGAGGEKGWENAPITRMMSPIRTFASSRLFGKKRDRFNPELLL
ncbi:MAG: hypothetical protein HXS44_02860 [Theionarchaea archaeon]|nr:hypothetical protein [Theionarchaea archaeon]